MVDTLSPRTGAIIAQLIPANEPLLGSLIQGPVSFPAGKSLSLNPGGNFRFTIELTGLLLFFYAATRLPNPLNSLRRLSVVAAVLGACLALFAMTQTLGGANHKIYWYFETGASFFGPFINKNHYPFFLNIAIGLTIGLLVERVASSRLGWAGSLNDSAVLWLLASIGFMLASIALSLSRGGFMAVLIASVAVTASLIQRGGSQAKSASYIALGIASGIAVLCWVGYDLVADRIATLTQGADIPGGRALGLLVFGGNGLLDVPSGGIGRGDVSLLGNHVADRPSPERGMALCETGQRIPRHRRGVWQPWVDDAADIGDGYALEQFCSISPVSYRHRSSLRLGGGNRPQLS